MMELSPRGKIFSPAVAVKLTSSIRLSRAQAIGMAEINCSFFIKTMPFSNADNGEWTKSSKLTRRTFTIVGGRGALSSFASIVILSPSSAFLPRFSSISLSFSMINPLKANGIRSTPLCRMLALSRRGGFEEWRFLKFYLKLLKWSLFDFCCFILTILPTFNELLAPIDPLFRRNLPINDQ
jgi:hypothetical protein